MGQRFQNNFMIYSQALDQQFSCRDHGHPPFATNFINTNHFSSFILPFSFIIKGCGNIYWVQLKITLLRLVDGFLVETISNQIILSLAQTTIHRGHPEVHYVQLPVRMKSPFEINLYASLDEYIWVGMMDFDAFISFPPRFNNLSTPYREYLLRIESCQKYTV